MYFDGSNTEGVAHAAPKPSVNEALMPISRKRGDVPDQKLPSERVLEQERRRPLELSAYEAARVVPLARKLNLAAHSRGKRPHELGALKELVAL